MEPILESLHVEERKLDATFSNVSMPLLNSLRAYLLDACTGWAFCYAIRHEYKVKDLDSETFRDIVYEVPVGSFAICKLEVDNTKGKKPLKIYSDDLIPTKPLEIKDLNLDREINMFVCLVVCENKEVKVKVLRNEGSLNDKNIESGIAKAIKECVKGDIEGAFVIKRGEETESTEILTNASDTIIHKNIKLMEIEKGDKISMTFVTDRGSPKEDPKWSAVSTCVPSRESLDRTRLKFSVKSPIYDCKEVLKKAVETQIEDLRKLLSLVENHEE